MTKTLAQSAYDSYVEFCKRINVPPLSQISYDNRTDNDIHKDCAFRAANQKAKQMQKNRARGH